MMRSAKKTYEIDMLHGAILPKLLRFAVPLTLSTMLQLLFNAADVVVVGRWAGDQLSGSCWFQYFSDRPADQYVLRIVHRRQHSGCPVLRRA